MKKIIAILLMVMIVGCVAFAEAHKKQIIVEYTLGLNELMLSKGSFLGDVKKATTIPAGWHVVQIVCISNERSLTKFLLVLEEN
jgi:hypothetical protein